LEDFMSFFTALVTSKIAAGLLAGGTIAAGGAATAAYTGTLPAPLQQTSHELIGAPAPAAVSTTAEQKPAAALHGKAKSADAQGTQPDATPVGPDATGPAAFGLCTAFTNGGLDPASTAYKSLADAANGSAGIAAYCKSVPVPGQSAEHRPETPGNPGTSGSSTKGTPPAQADKGLAHKPAAAGKP
jgi:hypothetical protein